MCARVDALGPEVTQEQLDASMSEWAIRAEVDILGAHDVRDDPSYAGRFQAPRLVWTLATPPRRGGPRIGGEAAVWHFISDRLRELRHLKAAATDGKQV